MDSKQRKRFAKYIKNLLKEHKLTEIEFADVLGVDRSTVNLWVNGKRGAGLNNMQKIMKKFGGVGELANIMNYV